MKALPAPARLGQHHLAYLRAVAEGIPMGEAAQRYLGISHGHEAITAHRAAVDLAATIARRRGDSRWRLIGLALPVASASLASQAPSIEEWAAAEGLEDWSADELEALYADRFGQAQEPGAQRRRARDDRLRRRRLELLQALEAAVDRASPSDAVGGWLAPAVADQLVRRGVPTLGELQQLIQRGGRWWRGLKAFGPVKAARLQAQVVQLLGPAPERFWPLLLDAAHRLSGADRANRPAGGRAGIDALNDLQAIGAWISARAGSTATATAYQREAERFALWMVLERNRALSDATAEDCRAYMDFLGAVPSHWISRRHVPRLAPGWAPFGGQLSVRSQRYAVTLLHSLFSWLVSSGYLAGNPWILVNRRIGDARDSKLPQLEQSRAFAPATWQALLDQAEREAGTPAGARAAWLLVFARATGLRPSELLLAKRGDFEPREGTWWLRVYGKGSRLRGVPVPGQALRATRIYFAARELDFEEAGPETPLLASLVDPIAPLSYQALHSWFKGFVRRALTQCTLTEDDRRHAARASAHWLRHTHATRAAENNVPPDVLQANLGQSDPRTTAGYYKAQMERRAREIERVYGA